MPRRYRSTSSPNARAAPGHAAGHARGPAAAPALAEDPLGRALDTAIAGDTRPLYAFLARHSGLPGVRANGEIVLAFASHAATRGKRSDAVIRTLATIDADRAPGGTELEFLPMCGVAAIGARGATDPKALPLALEYLEAAAEDLRYRVRDEVPRALARLGAARGAPLVDEVKGWMDGFFQAAAVLVAAADHAWLPLILEPDSLVDRLDEAFQLARGADRATERYPGYKTLVDALSTTAGTFAARFGAPVFDKLVAWSTVKEPKLRGAIAASVRSTRLTKRFGADVKRVHAALDASAPIRRDPNTDVGPTRRRSKKHQR